MEVVIFAEQCRECSLLQNNFVFFFLFMCTNFWVRHCGLQTLFSLDQLHVLSVVEHWKDNKYIITVFKAKV